MTSKEKMMHDEEVWLQSFITSVRHKGVDHVPTGYETSNPTAVQRRLRLKMTAKEAMLHIASHNAAHSRRERFAVHITEALNVAVEALKKRVPMAPVRDSLADRVCPACNAYIPFDALNDRITDAPRFCKHCGQALDWGENNEQSFCR